ncbi:MAG: hypothetical protein IKL27_00655 [Oscillospiraceae bacterium]|nr:hypothetical protein [Oscillospiraceae bacterium]
MRLIKKIFSILAALSIALTFAVSAFAKADTELDEALDISARYIYSAAKLLRCSIICWNRRS